LGIENKDLTHLQNNINKYNYTTAENLKDVQKGDILHYLQINDQTLGLLKDFITKVNTQEKNVA